MPTLAQSFLKLPTRSKIAIGLSALGIVAVMFFMLRLASAPSYTTLAAGLAPSDTGKVTAALDAQGIAYELGSNGTSVAVEKAAVAQARIALAQQGVATSALSSQKGFELFDTQKLGASDFQNQVTYQRALEGEIARTIQQVQGVQGAQVQLVLPEDSLFADEATPATAAVMLSGPSTGVESGAVRGIAQLVASSVKGLKTDNVTITDGTGQLLWPQGDGTPGAGGATSKLGAETRYETAMQASLNALLTQTLGPGKARVQVKADLNVDKTTLNKVQVDGKPVAAKDTRETERLQGGAAAAGGTAGTGANIPTDSANAAGGGANSNYNRRSPTGENIVPRTVTHTDVAPGGVNSLQIALVVDKSVSAADYAAIQKAVQGAAGFNQTRGDVFQASQVAFPKPAAAPKAGPVPVSMLRPLKWVGLGLATLVFLFFMSRHLKRREGEAIASPAWLREIEEPVSLAELEAPAPVEPTLILPPRAQAQSAQALDQLMDREPDRVAAQVRQWMSED
jgi:flagellar M-ring protein FliF